MVVADELDDLVDRLPPASDDKSNFMYPLRYAPGSLGGFLISIDVWLPKLSCSESTAMASIGPYMNSTKSANRMPRIQVVRRVAISATAP